MNITIAQAYPEPLSHRRVPHPVSDLTVRLMTPLEFVQAAAEMLSAVCRSGLKTIISLESGAAPLAKVCRMLAEKQGFNLAWHSLKIWRESSKHYWLNPKPALSEPVLLFDEYVDSGTTMQKAIKQLRMLGCELNPKIICYCWLAGSNPLKQHLEYAVHQERGSYYWENGGAYPCENRIDLIGYFYSGANTVSGPKYLKDYDTPVSLSEEKDCLHFLNELWQICLDESLLSCFREQAKLDPVRSSLEDEDCLRLFIAFLELSLDRSPALSSFVYQLEDMYGPMWSPYPDSYHLDFQQASIAAGANFKKLPRFCELLKKYQYIREPLIQLIAHICEKRRNHWDQQISQIIEEDL